MKYGTESGELIGVIPPELEIEIRAVGPALSGLEPLERLFGADDAAGGGEAGSGRLTGPAGDPCDATPTARQLRRFKPTDDELREFNARSRPLGGADLAVLTVDQYGAPSYGPLGGPEGFVFHTPENVDHSLAQAIAIARWQASTGNTSGGSYMGILGWNGSKPMSDPLGWTMVRSVPWNVAAGGLSTRRDAVWAPDRFPWIRSLLSAGAFADPNRYLQQIAISGKAAWWASKLATAAGRAEVRGALIALARWIRTLETAYSFDAVMTLHRHWQTDRTDPAGLDFAELVLEEYVKLDESSAPADPLADANAKVAALTARIGAKDARFDAAADRVSSLETNVARRIAEIRAELTAGRNA